MKVSMLALTGLIALTLVLAVAGCRGQTGKQQAVTAPGGQAEGSLDAASESTGQAEPSSGAAAGAGMKAYVDPKTGELTDKPPAGSEPLPGDVKAPHGTVGERPAQGGGMLLGNDKGPQAEEDNEPDEE